eukprot:scaffold2297_cov102-Isochrysis_galbana.AAC.8
MLHNCGLETSAGAGAIMYCLVSHVLPILGKEVFALEVESARARLRDPSGKMAACYATGTGPGRFTGGD